MSPEIVYDGVQQLPFDVLVLVKLPTLVNKKKPTLVTKNSTLVYQNLLLVLQQKAPGREQHFPNLFFMI